jgi:hypothetical protein
MTTTAPFSFEVGNVSVPIFNGPGRDFFWNVRWQLQGPRGLYSTDLMIRMPGKTKAKKVFVTFSEVVFLDDNSVRFRAYVNPTFFTGMTWINGEYNFHSRRGTITFH